MSDSAGTASQQPLEDLALTAEDRVLCVVAHPDDMEYGTSAAVARWTDEGIPVSYLLLTSGEAGIRDLAPERTGPMRAEEQRRACAEVGVEDLRILDFPDGMLEPTLALRRAIAATIRELRPTVVVTMGWAEEVAWGLNQADHRAAGISVLDALRDADNPWVFRDLLDHPPEDLHLPAWHVGRLLVFGAEHPTHRLEITGEPLERSIRSLEAHRGYLEALPDHPEPRAMLEEFTRDDDATARTSSPVHAVVFRVYPM
ncbi:PIG-L deacetylase family protein [Citricoccus sp. NR2]|uniref:PIG-L deacetylase family protein n=1 Tax=Citricoccus sp. NR2 TaxID=3004095 RepID=UPI0022DD4EC0|nr:PIG-L deacetylase family protein [Citricoccus sp. NR2]WBL19450.1 PIG-L family deacetylase [Citricoccus sp. NR2]